MSQIKLKYNAGAAETMSKFRVESAESVRFPFESGFACGVWQMRIHFAYEGEHFFSFGRQTGRRVTLLA